MLPTADINILSLTQVVCIKIVNYFIYEQTRYPDLLLALVIVCYCSYVTKCFNLFIGITSLYLLNSFVNIIITFLFNSYLRVPYGMCLSVL